MIVFPIYSLAQVTVMPLAGATYYVILAHRKGRFGRYGFGYRRLRPPATSPRKRLEHTPRLPVR